MFIISLICLWRLPSFPVNQKSQSHKTLWGMNLEQCLASTRRLHEDTVHWWNEPQTPGCPQSCQRHPCSSPPASSSQLWELTEDQERGFRGWMHCNNHHLSRLGSRPSYDKKIQELQCAAWPFKAIMIGIFKKPLIAEFWNYCMLDCIFRVMKACQSNTGSKLKKKDPDYSLAEFPKCGAGICE